MHATTLDMLFMTTIMDGVKRRGWPKRQGLRKRLVVEKSAFAFGTADAVRIALLMGREQPDFTRTMFEDAITAASEGLPPELLEDKDEAIELTIDDVAYNGSKLIQASPSVYPLWRRFVVLTPAPPNAKDFQVRDWRSERGTIAWDPPITRPFVQQGENMAQTALLWAYRHPDDAAKAFRHQPPQPLKDEENEIAVFSRLALNMASADYSSLRPT